MGTNKKIIDVLPKLLKRLSSGEGLNIPTLSKEFDIPEKTLQDNIKKYLLPLFIANVKYDKTTRNWTARKNFLSETLLSVEEIVTIAILESTSSRYGEDFVVSTESLFKRFRKRASLRIFKKIKMEKFNDEEEVSLAIVKNAIDDKMILLCDYHNKARKIYPLKIVQLEGYWYLFLWDTKDDVMKTFYFKEIENIELEGSQYEYPKTNTINRLDEAINAFFKDKDSFPIELQVHKKVSIYFRRLPLSKSQQFFPCLHKDYEKMTLNITDEMEIIPTIQRYLPYIKVLSPTSLSDTIEKNLKDYYTTELS